MSDHPIDRDRMPKLVSTIFADDLRAKRVASLANAAVNVLEVAALGIHAIGRALACHSGLDLRHAVKQVDRLLSNTASTCGACSPAEVPSLLRSGPRASGRSCPLA